MWKCCSMRVSRSSAWRLLMPSVLKKSSSARRCSRGTLKWAAASCRISSVVFSSVLMDVYFHTSGQVRQRVVAFDEFAEAGFDGWLREEVAEDIDFALQVVVRDGFDKALGCGGGLRIEFSDLRGRGPSDSQGVALGSHLADESDRLCFRGVDTAAREKQVTDDSIADVALQARDSAEARDQAEAQFREGEAGHLVGDDHVAGEGELEASAEDNTVNGGDGGEGRGVDGVHHAMDALEEIADARQALPWGHGLRTLEKLAEVGAGAETLGTCTRNNQRASVFTCGCERIDELFELNQGRRADFVARRAVEHELDGAA